MKSMKRFTTLGMLEKAETHDLTIVSVYINIATAKKLKQFQNPTAYG